MTPGKSVDTGKIDAQDSCVGMRAAKDRHHGLSGQRDIVDKGSVAGQEAKILQTAYGFSDISVFLCLVHFATLMRYHPSHHTDE